MGIQQFVFDSRLSRAFVGFSYDLYRDDPCWIPPFADELFYQLSPQFGLNQLPGHRHLHFLATCRGETVGRISAMVNPNLQDRDGTPVGAVGFFESVCDPAVAEDLFHAALSWLVDEQKMPRIWGPINFDIWHGYRLMTRGFDQPFYGEPYNKSYYPEFFERCGFEQKQLWNSVEMGGTETLLQLARRGQALYPVFFERGYRLEALTSWNLSETLGTLYRLLTDSFSGFLGYTPISPAEFRRLFSPLRFASRPPFVLLVHDDKQQPCGFAICLLDVADAVRAMRGRRGLRARARFVLHRRKAERILFHLIGKTQEECRKRNGLGRVLLARMLEQILAQGYDNVLCTLIAEGNSSRALLQGRAKDDRRQYALYEWTP